MECKKIKILNLFAVFAVIMFSMAVFFLHTAPVFATTLLSDDFTGTTIDTNKWVEIENQGAGDGGSAGNVRQNGTMAITGNGTWNANGIRTVQTFDRTLGDITVDFDWTISNCSDSAASGGFMFGPWINGTTPDANYLLSRLGGGFNLYLVNYATATLTGTTCTNGVSKHFKVVILKAGGVDVYFNNSATPNASLSAAQAPASFNNKKISLQAKYTSTSTFDNFIVTQAGTPNAPSGLSATGADGQASLSWTAPNDNGSAITDYVIESRIGSGSWSTFSDGVSTATSAAVTGLTNGTLYEFRVSAVNANGTSTVSSTANGTPFSSTPSAPTATSVSVSGNTLVEEVITGSYVFLDSNADSEGVSTFRWLRADTSGGIYSAISGATSTSYILTNDDLNKYIKFEVTPISAVAPATGIAVLSSAVGPITQTTFFNHILSTGQSLSVGLNGAPALSTTQPYSNKMLSGTSLVPLVESSVETMSSALANGLTSLSGGTFQSAVTMHGVGATAYSGLKKGTTPYNNGMTQATNVKNAATALGLTDRVIGVTVIHGESDHQAGLSSSYEANLAQWQSDYNNDVKAITGQTRDILLFTDQMSSQTGYGSATSGIPIAQLAASEDYPSKIVLVGPKYFFTYADTAHLVNTSYRWLGEYYAKVMKKVFIDQQTWRPLSPDTITRSGNAIYAKFHVPAGVLAFDTTLVTARTNKGFEYYDDSSSASISSVQIISSDTVKITLNTTPTGANQRLRYAYTGGSGVIIPGAQNAGSAGGNLRDTDNAPSLYGNTLYNWAVHFDKTISIDNTAPVISFTNNVAVGPAQSDTIAVDWGDATVKKWDYDTDGVCSNTAGDYSKTDSDLMSQNTEINNGKYICLYAEDSVANKTTLASDNDINIDIGAPNISATSSTPNSSGATINWTTDENSSSRVQYGLTTSYGNLTPLINTSPRVLSHSVSLSGLLSCATYNYRVNSIDSASNSATSANNSFTTTGCTGSAPILSQTSNDIATSTGATINLLSSGKGISLIVPPSFTTVASSATFQFKKIDNTSFVATAGKPTGKNRIGTDVFNIKAFSNETTVISSFAKNLTVSLNYNSEDIVGMDEASLVIYRYNGSDWHALSNCSVDTSTKTVSCETSEFSDFAIFGDSASSASSSSSASSGGMPTDWLDLPKIPSGGLKVIVNNGINTISNRVVALSFNAGSDVKKMAISLTGDFNDASQENYQPTKQLDICSKFGGSIENITCPDGEYTIYVKFYTQYGVASDIISQKINFLSVPQLPKHGISVLFTKNLKLGSIKDQVKILQKFLNANGFIVAKTGIGSAGHETNIFGLLTKKAVQAFQLKYKIAKKGDSGFGMVGLKTREKLNELLK